MASIKKRKNNTCLIIVSCGYNAQKKKLTKTKHLRSPLV